MNLAELFFAPPSPCEKFSCAKFAECKETLVSCQSFSLYVEEGRAIHPAMEMDDSGKFRMTGGPRPTREEFDKMSRDD